MRPHAVDSRISFKNIITNNLVASFYHLVPLFSIFHVVFKGFEENLRESRYSEHPLSPQLRFGVTR